MNQNPRRTKFDTASTEKSLIYFNFSGISELATSGVEVVGTGRKKGRDGKWGKLAEKGDGFRTPEWVRENTLPSGIYLRGQIRAARVGWHLSVNYALSRFR